MPTPQIPNISDNASLEEMRDCYIGMQRYLSYLLSTLDTLNISRLDAEVIIAESITAGKLAAGSVQTDNLQAGAITTDKIDAGAITTDKLDAGAVTAEKITVDELSAISANLGHITAGLIESIQIFGSYIATRNGTYPRAEMSVTDHLFAALKDADNHIKIRPDISGSPGQRFTSGGVVLASITTYLGFLELWVPSILKLTAPELRVNGWGSLYSENEGKTLAEELDEIRNLLDEKADYLHSHSVTIPPGSAGGTFTVT